MTLLVLKEIVAGKRKGQMLIRKDIASHSKS
jgi:hypothetical protein